MLGSQRCCQSCSQEVGREVTDTDDVSKAVDDLNRAWLAVVESQSARIAELESEVDAFQEQQNNLAALIPDEYDGDEYQGALIERFVRDAAGRFEQQVAERDALAAVIEKVREYVTRELTYHFDYPVEAYHRAVLLRILDAARSDILAEHDARVIHEAAEAIRAHATAPTELIYPHVQIDALIAWVADWMENPPEWVKVSYRKKAGE